MKSSVFNMFMFTVLLSLCALSATAYSAELKEDVKFIDLDGNESMLSDYKGKWVIVNLWATWCPPCLVEIPDLIMFHEEHKDKNAIVIGVNYEDIAISKVKRFAKEQMINFPIVRFEGKMDGINSPFGRVYGLPATYMVAPDGQVVAARTGMVDQKMLENFMNKYTEMNAVEEVKSTEKITGKHADKGKKEEE
ncbi:Thioredoxin [hydrothermal vent metagenome]|uniref:Thioredoxin n=1 Tax=hydrothermal vent metagenome TaxID=652676 RepID=A0A3B0VQ52_9ZZZZ